MCLICADYAKGRLTTREARRALGEMAMTLDPEHVRDLEKRLDEAERDEKKSGRP